MLFRFILTPLLKVIDTREMALLMAIICVIAELPTTTRVLQSFGMDFWESNYTCGALAALILFFTAKKSFMALPFAIFEASVCLYYFWTHAEGMAVIPGTLFAIVMPFSVFATSFYIPQKYSDLKVKDNSDGVKDNPSINHEQLNNIEEKLNLLSTELNLISGKEREKRDNVRLSQLKSQAKKEVQDEVVQQLKQLGVDTSKIKFN